MGKGLWSIMTPCINGLEYVLTPFTTTHGWKIVKLPLLYVDNLAMKEGYPSSKEGMGIYSLSQHLCYTTMCVSLCVCVCLVGGGGGGEAQRIGHTML